jgi:hypothetical protein
MILPLLIDRRIVAGIPHGLGDRFVRRGWRHA